MSEHQLKQQRDPTPAAPQVPSSPRQTPLRSESLARAQARSKMIRSKGSVEGDDVDQLAMFGNIKPPEGFAYQLKRMSVWNQPTPGHQSMLQRNGWEPVPVERHPEVMPQGSSGYIEKDGLMLMEIPADIVEEKRVIADRTARAPIEGLAHKLADTPQGDAPRMYPSDGRPRSFDGES